MKPYKHFRIGGGWKRMVDARGLGRGCTVGLVHLLMGETRPSILELFTISVTAKTVAWGI